MTVLAQTLNCSSLGARSLRMALFSGATKLEQLFGCYNASGGSRIKPCAKSVRSQVAGVTALKRKLEDHSSASPRKRPKPAHATSSQTCPRGPSLKRAHSTPKQIVLPLSKKPRLQISSGASTPTSTGICKTKHGGVTPGKRKSVGVTPQSKRRCVIPGTTKTPSKFLNGAKKNEWARQSKRLGGVGRSS